MAVNTVVLHVCESFVGGVKAAIRDYIRNTPECSHYLLFAPRADMPLGDSDLADFTRVFTFPRGHFARITTVRRVAAELGRPVVHAHSSYAGVYVRLALRASSRQRIVYTPHCYAFEREDVQRTVRKILIWTESLLSINTSVFAGCSVRETALSKWPLSKATTIFVPNVALVDELDCPRQLMPKACLTVAGVGRVAPQKDPEFFLAAIRALRDRGIEIDAVWIGGGDIRGGKTEAVSTLVSGGIRTTGWLNRAAALQELRHADLYLHTAAWEGFPITVLEAAALNVPTVVRRISAFEGMAVPASITKPEELAERWEEFSSVQGRLELISGMRAAVADSNDDLQCERLLQAWGVKIAERCGHDEREIC